MTEIKPRTLSQVITFIKKLVDDQLANKYFWLKVEVSNINFHNAGHCYLDLVETLNGKSIAQCRATIWATNLQNIRRELESDFPNILKKGAEILCLVDVQFNEVFGLSINIHQVDKYFALGELEKKKQETIGRLKAEQLFEKNKIHKVPTVIQNIAIVGSPGTSGHTDLVKQLEKNEYSFKFNITYFNCQVQGERAEREIIERLNATSSGIFDIVALVRGGGSKLDLEVFNSYEVCKAIANLNKPVFTGIGHETDSSAVDLVANTYFKTPTALGGYIVDRNQQYWIKVQTTYTAIKSIYDLFMERQNGWLRHALGEFQNKSTSYIRLRRGNLHTVGNRIMSLVREKLSLQHQFLGSSKQVISVSVPGSLTAKRERLREISELCLLRTQQVVRHQLSSLSHKRELIKLHTTNTLRKQTDFLNNGIEFLTLIHPDNVLERGYSITRTNGSFIDKGTDVNVGDTVEIELFNKRIKASVISINLKDSKWKHLLLTRVPQQS